MANKELSNSPESKKQHYLTIFLKFRNDYSDEIPANIITHADEGYYKHKCTGNFFAAVALYINLALGNNIFPDSIKASQLKKFTEFVKTLDFSRRITKENISYANEVLDLIIATLST